MKVHQHSCRAYFKGNRCNQSLGKTHGGKTTKIHSVVDALGHPLEIALTEGQWHDMTQAHLCLKGPKSDYVICDKAYDDEYFRRCIAHTASKAVIPPKKADFILHYTTHSFIKNVTLLKTFLSHERIPACSYSIRGNRADVPLLSSIGLHPCMVAILKTFPRYQWGNSKRREYPDRS